MIEIGIGFGFNGGEAECCEFGCALDTDNSCNSEKQQEAFNAGVSILTDITQNFLIDEEEHICFEDPPGTFNVAEGQYLCEKLHFFNFLIYKTTGCTNLMNFVRKRYV